MRILLTLSLSILCTIYSSMMGQVTEHGRLFINPQITGLDISQVKQENYKTGINTSFAIGMGVLLTERMAVIGNFGMQINNQNEQRNNSFQVEGGLRLYLIKHWYAQGMIGYQKNLANNIGSEKRPDFVPLSAETGISIFVSRRFAIEPGVYWKYSLADTYRRFGFKLGLAFYL
ncbi:MAG: hypothetical protein ACRC6R_04455 [Bacteroidales bacterium]